MHHIKKKRNTRRKEKKTFRQNFQINLYYIFISFLFSLPHSADSVPFFLIDITFYSFISAQISRGLKLIEHWTMSKTKLEWKTKCFGFEDELIETKNAWADVQVKQYERVVLKREKKSDNKNFNQFFYRVVYHEL